MRTMNQDETRRLLQEVISGTSVATDNEGLLSALGGFEKRHYAAMDAIKTQLRTVIKNYDEAQRLQGLPPRIVKEMRRNQKTYQDLLEKAQTLGDDFYVIISDLRPEE